MILPSEVIPHTHRDQIGRIRAFNVEAAAREIVMRQRSPVVFPLHEPRPVGRDPIPDVGLRDKPHGRGVAAEAGQRNTTAHFLKKMLVLWDSIKSYLSARQIAQKCEHYSL